MRATRRVAVVGAGVSGLAAAVELRRLAAGAPQPVEVTVFEAATRPGGKLRTEEFSGAPFDLGAESLLLRGTDTGAALSQLGLEAELVRPGTTSAGIWNGKRLMAIPKGSVLGVPLFPWRPDAVRALGLAGAARATLEPWLRRPAPDPDQELGPFVSSRVGRRVLQRLVEPLLGGVYAGPAQQLSLGAVAPQLLAAAAGGASLLRNLRRPAPPSPGEVGFASFAGGLGQLVERLVAALPEGSLRLDGELTLVQPIDQGRLRLQARGAAPVDFDAALLAVPAPAAAALVQPWSPELAALLRRLEYASVATVSLAYPDAALSRALPGSGFLIQRRPRRTVTACTFMDRKWPHLRRPGRTLLRASVGSFGDEWVLALDDTTLVTAVHRELRGILGLSGLPLEARVERWYGALPQYRTGHLAWRAAVAEATARLPISLELTGAAYDGLGVAACLRQGSLAARQLWARLATAPAVPGGPVGAC